MANLQTNYAGLTLKNPLIAASSGLTNTHRKIIEMEKSGIGAIVLKSLFEEQIESHSEKLMETSDYPEASDYINTYVEMNHMDKYLELIRTAKAECPVPIIASINCYKLTRWTDFAKTIEAAGADALELNIFVINTGEFEDNYLEESYLKIVRELKNKIQIPIIVKMARTFSNLSGLVAKLQAAGADAAVLFNRYYPLDIDIDRMEITSGKIFTNPADFHDTLRWTAIISGRVNTIDIACSTGAHTWEDVVKGILAGASAVQLCSTLYQNGLGTVTEMLTQLRQWMDENYYDTIDDFKGKLNYANIPNPALYERAQFMKYFSNHQ